MHLSDQSIDVSESRSLRTFLVSALLVAALCVSGGFLGMALKDRQLIQEEMLQRARRDFRNIVLMRQWNAEYGGVFVEKKPGMVSNPYLEKPDLLAADGRIFTMKNPALMTRELSERMSRDQGYAFHITSLRPLNPRNAADPRETEALKAFERGEQERHWIEDMGRQAHFRFMAPLRVEKSCLACHAKQGYQPGDIRGGISVSFRVSELQAKLRQNLVVVSVLALLTLALLAASVLVLFRQLVRRLREAREQLKTLATTDALTGLMNRRSILQRLEEEGERHRRNGSSLAVLLMDVDHFKRVNDTFGHLEGDQILRLVAQQLRACLRVYDAVGRYGGEEFLAVLPGTGRADALQVAERIRGAVEANVRAADTHPVTISLGLTLARPGEAMTGLLGRADEAMYRAKESGRNRVEILETEPSPEAMPGD